MDIDIETAKNANVKIISATWGWSSVDDLKKTEPDWIINNPKELLKTFESNK